MKKKTIQTKLSLLWVAVFIAVFLAGKSWLLPAWAAAQQQETSPTANSNPFGLVLSTPAADGSISHTVKEGEFLYPIAQAYGITLDELLALNGLTAESIIQPGQVLIIRRATSPQPAAHERHRAGLHRHTAPFADSSTHAYALCHPHAYHHAHTRPRHF